MKSLSLALNAVLIVLVAILFYWHFRPGTAAVSSAGSPAAVSGPVSGARIAYVDLDSLQAHYTFFLKQQAALQQRQQSIEQELNTSAQKLQQEAADFQKKAPTMTQAEGESAQRSLMQKQQALQNREQMLRQQFLQQQNDFNTQLHQRIDRFLKTYNAQKKYDYILSYSAESGNILYKNKAYDITNEVIQGLNAADSH